MDGEGRHDLEKARVRYAIETARSRTRDTRERTLPTDHSHAALAGTPAQPANISVTRRRSALPSPFPSTQRARKPKAAPHAGKRPP